MQPIKNYLLVVECAIEYQGRFLLIERPQGGYAGGLLSFAGGKVDAQDESQPWDMLRAAVRREVREELGIELHGPLTYVTSSYFVTDKGIPIVDTIFHCQLQDMPSVYPSPREVSSYDWLTAAEIHAAPNAPEWLKKYITLIAP